MTVGVIVLTVAGVVAAIGLIALVVWVKRLDRDSFDEGAEDTLTDEQRRINQLGIGLSGGGGSMLGGH